MKEKITLLLILLSTIPLSAQWISQNSGVTENLQDVFCISESVVITVGDNGIILKTNDGGENWIQKTSGTFQYLTKLQFTNSEIGYAVGANGTLLKTTDAGESWTFIDAGTNSDLYGLSVLSENIFFVSGDNGLIKKTVDGGISFTSQNIASTQTVQDIQYLNEEVGYALVGSADPFSQEKMLFKTTDEGNTWSILVNEFVDAFFFVDENMGFINKSHDGMYKTMDGGMNLESYGLSSYQETDLFSLDGNIIWDTGFDLMLCNCSYFCIRKRGNSQNSEFQQFDNCYEDIDFNPFQAIHFANETHGYAVGANGLIYKNATGINEYLGIDETAKRNAIKIYPNPSTEFITISFNELLNQPFSAEITDSLGKRVYSNFFQPENPPTIDVRTFPKGVYFLTIVSQEKSQTQKIIVN